MPLRPQLLYYAAIIATCQVNEASLTLDTLQLSRSNVNSVVRSYLSPTPVGVGVGTSLIWAVDQTLSSLRESGYARLLLLYDSHITPIIITDITGRCNVRIQILYTCTTSSEPDPFRSAGPIAFSMQHAESMLHTESNQRCATERIWYGGREVQRLTSVIRHPSSVIRHLSSVISFLVGAVMGVACLLASAHVF